MRVLVGLFSFIIFSISPANCWAETIWIAGEGGIYRCVLDEDSGELSEPSLSAAFPSGSFLAIHPKLDVIYSSYAGKPVFGYASLVEAAEAGAFEIQSLNTSVSNAPTYLSVSPDGKILGGVHYSGKSTYFFTLAEDGSITDKFEKREHWGSGPLRAQKQARPHWGGFSRDGLAFHAVDLGSDEIWTYKIGAKLADIELMHRVKLPLGTGPRHLVLNPDRGYAYTNGEMSLQITSFHYDVASKRFSPLQHISTVADGEGNEGSSLSEIQMDQAGRYLYAAVRGNDLIVVFSIDPETGLLSLVEREDSIVARPRNFTLSHSGNWLLAAGQDSSDIVVFRVDPETGELEASGNSVSVPHPICVRAWGRM